MPKDQFGIEFEPAILTVSSNFGSVLGGNELIITGDGFLPGVTVISLGSSLYTLENAEIDYETIKFVTNPELEGEYEIGVYVNGKKVPCDQICIYNFVSTGAPTLSSVWPEYVDSTNTIVTISGENFGEIVENVDVQIGSQICTVLYVNDTEITCSLLGLEIGPQQVNLRVRCN